MSGTPPEPANEYAPNKPEEYAAAGGIGLLVAHLLPSGIGWLLLGGAVVSYGVRWYLREHK
jgi:hypothetical protein